jgi:hypothetical protein
MRNSSSFSALIFCIILGVGALIAFVAYGTTDHLASMLIGIVAFILACFASITIKVANQWEKAVILRLGKFRTLAGPGLFFIIPIIDEIPTGSTPGSSPPLSRRKRP